MQPYARALAFMVSLSTSVPAAAQYAQVYGRLYPEVIWTRMTGATPPGTPLSTLASPATGDSFASVVKMDSSNSRMGFRGEEPLGNGVNAFFLIEQRIIVDTGGSQVASRNTYAGLASDRLGAIKLGGFDTVYKEIGDTLSFLGVSSGNLVSNSNMLSKQGFGNNSAGSFHLRRVNSTRYESPVYDGWQAMLQYSPDEAKTSSRNAFLWSIGVIYDSGPLYGAIAYEIHNDTFGGSRNVPSALSNFNDANARSRDTGLRGTLQYRFENHTIELNAASIEYDERGGKAGRFENYRHAAFSIGLDSKWGDGWRTAAAFDYAGAGSCRLFDGVTCTTSGLDGRQLSIGAAYYLSKRTYLFALYAKLWNGRAAQYNNIDGFDVPPGADPQQLAFGITHSF